MRTSGACCSSRCDESSARHFEKRRLGSAHRGTAEIQRKRMAATRAQRQRWHSRGHSQRHSSVRVGHVAADRPRWSHCCTRAKGACETSRLAGGEATAASSSSLASTAELPAAQCAKSHHRSWGLISCRAPSLAKVPRDDITPDTPLAPLQGSFHISFFGPPRLFIKTID